MSIPIATPKVGFDEIQEVISVLKSKMLAQGKKVKEFEDKFAQYIGVKYAVACSSGTSALHMAYIALDLKKGDEVITTPFTFKSTINMIEAVGAIPVFVDIKDDFNINEKLIQKAITKKTKAVVPVHLFGKPCNMKKIMEIAKKNNLKVIEDCAQACGAEFNKKKVGSFGDIGTFSFYPTKIITCGEGGMCITNRKDLAEKLKQIRNHGLNDEGKFVSFGYNFRMTDIEAAIGIAQLEKIQSFIDVRKSVAFAYNYHLKKLADIPYEDDNTVHVYNNYSFRVKNRDLFVKNLQANEIGARVYYDKPFANLPNATKISKEILSIPIRPNLTTEEMNHIIYNVKENI